MGRLGLASVLVCVLLLGVAGAQPGGAAPATSPEGNGAAAGSDDAQQRKDAREHFLRGLAFAKAGACGSALGEFAASLRLFRTRAALTNTAVCLRELKRFVEARETYSTLLSESGNAITAEERATLEAELEGLSAQIGEIRVESEPQGAVVVIDAQQRGVTPLAAPIWVDAGVHSVRVFRPGFSSLEASVVVAGKQSSTVRAVLEPIRHVGSLVVRESSGAVLDVLVNGAVMGQTPWQGVLPPGTYSVALQGPQELGTAPHSASVRTNQTATLILTASKLDAEVRIEPSPANSNVSIDDVAVGSGVWLGRLSSGAHRVSVSAEGYLPVTRAFTARRAEREIVRVQLVRDLRQPAEPARRAYLEAVAGLAFTPSLGGSADDSCAGTTANLQGVSADACRDSTHHPGMLAGLRVGYLVAPQMGIEFFLGYMHLSESLTRRMRAAHDGGGAPLFSDDYRDTTKARGPLAAVSAGYRFLERTPITLRVWLGVGRLRVDTTNSGTFNGGVLVDGMKIPIDQQRLTTPELTQRVWVPFAGPELRIGYNIAGLFDADIGVAALLLVPGKTPRVGSWVGASGARRAPILPPGADDNLGVFKLPDEQALGTALALVPSLGLRYRF